MKYSFVIPTYNRANIIVKTLDSVIEQDFKDYEIIVVDDASTDNTRQVVDTYLNGSSNITYVILERNSGANVAKNYGARIANGDYLIFLDSDDTLENSNSLSKLHDENLNSNYPDILMYACRNIDSELTIKNKNFTGFVNFSDYFKNKFRGEYLPVVNRQFFYKWMFYEDINGGEGITWKKLTYLAGSIYLSSTVIRVYDNKGVDRLSYLNKKNCRRIRDVFIKDLEVNFFTYLKIYPAGILYIIIRILYYSFRVI